VVKHLATAAFVILMVVHGTAEARDTDRPRGSHATRTTQPHTRTTERQRTESGRTRSDTVTRADGSIATRNAVVEKSESGYTRATNYSTADGRTGAKADVIQRTEDGYSRNTTHTTPDGATHTRSVDVSCDKDAQKCVKQVDVGQQP
jgi:hypothetical protein